MKKLKKDMLAGFLDRLSKKYTVIAPVKSEKGYTEFKGTRDFSRVSLEDNCLNPVKEFFFPQNEELFRYMDEEVVESTGGEKMIIFGVRPCDIRSVEVLDRVFLDERFIDIYYKKRRDNAVIIGYTCPKSEPGCFCRSFGIDPGDSGFSDLSLFEEAENYYLKLNNEKAAFIMEDPVLSDADAGLPSAGHGQDAGMEIEFPLDQKQLFHADIWEKLYQKCIGCGTCTYLCPTCHCFEFCNRKSSEGIQRIRCWDSCQYALFTEHASGHNPRSTQKERIRQRLMHKFSYYPQNHGVAACVGCGRCLRKCPVAFDLREALKTMEEYIKESGMKTDG